MVTWLSVSLLKPFRALRYDPERAGSLDRLVAPPYDVVTPELRAELLAASPYNAVRLVRPDAPEEAGQELAAWREEGVLVRDEEPAAWVLEETFVGPDRVERTRVGLVARIRLEPYATGRILPHERTFPGPKEARLRLLRATRTKLSPILLLHEGAWLVRSVFICRSFSMRGRRGLTKIDLRNVRAKRQWMKLSRPKYRALRHGLRGPFLRQIARSKTR